MKKQMKKHDNKRISIFVNKWYCVHCYTKNGEVVSAIGTDHKCRMCKGVISA